jgi:hypothetical protein
MRYGEWKRQAVCLTQKEYATAGDLGKSKRQHWDIAVLKVPLAPVPDCDALPYDCLQLAAAIEFGLNEKKKHLVEDLRRLAHEDASVEQGFILHLYRLSDRDAEVSSRRDIRPGKRRVLSLKAVAGLSKNSSVEVVYGLYNGTDPAASGAWLIERGVASRLS